ncbi:hypothetical protein [Streptomyces ziwulingensis]|uniref:Membrane protein n=1 Tax=Streptomyces ziwulingensis TaxID=1045501 RepID=A0ABP9AT59_9ACTN
MPTTRHSLNTLRRRQAREALRPPHEPADKARPEPAGPRTTAEDSAPGGREEPRDRPQRTRTRRPAPTGTARTRTPRSGRPLVALCLLTLLLGAFAGWAHARAENLRDDPAARNTALSDTARTSEIKGRTTKAVAALFSYDHADPAAFDQAAKEWLTGRAVAQHRDLFGAVRTQADKEKAVITTTVTDSAVERIDGDRARVLVYADQSSVSTAGDKKAEDDGTYAGAMLALDVVHRDGHWLVSGIDTFGR